MEIDKTVVTYATIALTRTEMRVLINRICPPDTWLHQATAHFLPANHEEMAAEMAEKLRRFHDGNPWPEDALE